LGEGESEDAWFISRVLQGAVVGERQKMPPFEGLLSQEAIWSIRTYIDAQPE
jgi:mono/diheme cytochrome c family protein